jgi:hypothetical protein
MERPYYKLAELAGKNGLTYNKLWRSIETLREAEVIQTFTGARGTICLTLDEKLILDKFLTYLDRCKGSQKEAFYLLRLELLERKVEQLQEENRKLHALVEVRPPWWVRLMRWLSGIPGLRRFHLAPRRRSAKSRPVSESTPP